MSKATAKNKDLTGIAGVDTCGEIVVALRKATVFCCLLYVALRPLGVGLEVAEPEAGVLLCLSLVGMLFYLLSAVAQGRIPLPALKVAVPVLAFTVCVGLAVFGEHVSYYRSAADLGMIWLGDLFVFVAIAGSSSWRHVRRAYLCVLAAGVVVAGVYALYQFLYAAEYLRQMFEAGGTAQHMGEQMVRGFNIRLHSTRVAGPYAYANALAAVCLLALPFLYKWCAGGNGKIYFKRGLVLLPVVMGLVLSGSKAGIAAAKLAEWICLAVLICPPGRRLRGLLPTGGMVAVATLLSGGLAVGVYLLIGPTVGMLAFSVFWWLELLVLEAFFQRLGKTVRNLFGAGLIVAAIVGIAGVAYVAQSGDDAPALVRKARSFAVKNLSVRYNYWLAAADIAMDHPVRGVGLDNFGEYYFKYKTLDGWEVKRAHNHYLQLAVDGGLPLLGAFLLMWIGIFWSAAGNVKNQISVNEADNCFKCDSLIELDLRFIYKCGLATGIAAFVLTYLYFIGNTFSGLGIEYFFAEVFARAGSVRAANGGLYGLFIHGFVNLLLLPGVWVAVFHVAYNKYPKDGKIVRTMLLLALAMVLIHAAFDFILYHSAVSGMLWVVAGCAVAAKGSGLELKSVGLRIGVGVLVFGAGLVLLTQLAYPWLGGVTARNLAQKISYSAEQMRQREQSLDLMKEALEQRPDDAQLHSSAADLLWMYGMPRQAQEQMSLAVALQPRAASLHVALGKMLQKNNPLDPRVTDEFSQAIVLYPLKPAYRLMLARSLLRQSKVTQAAQAAVEALRIHGEVSDDRAKLKPEQLQEARAIVSMAKKKAGASAKE